MIINFNMGAPFRIFVPGFIGTISSPECVNWGDIGEVFFLVKYYCSIARSRVDDSWPHAVLLWLNL